VGERVLRAISAPTLEPERRVFWTVAGAVTVLEDITLFKQLDQMKSEFVNMVAHELRSPLVSIRRSRACSRRDWPVLSLKNRKTL